MANDIYVTDPLEPVSAKCPALCPSRQFSRDPVWFRNKRKLYSLIREWRGGSSSSRAQIILKRPWVGQLCRDLISQEEGGIPVGQVQLCCSGLKITMLGSESLHKACHCHPELLFYTVPEMSTALSLKELSSKGLQVVPYEKVKLDKAQRKIKRLSFIIQILRQLLMGFVGNINISGRKIGNDGETVLLISSYLFSFRTCTQFFQIFHY